MYARIWERLSINCRTRTICFPSVMELHELKFTCRTKHVSCNTITQYSSDRQNCIGTYRDCDRECSTDYIRDGQWQTEYLAQASEFPGNSRQTPVKYECIKATCWSFFYLLPKVALVRILRHTTVCLLRHTSKWSAITQ